MDNLTVSLTMWGDLRDDYNWLAWYTDMKRIFQMFELSITHLGVTGSQYPKKVVTVARKEKEILKKIEDGNLLYKMDRKDTPWLYAMGENDISFYKSLRVMKDL